MLTLEFHVLNLESYGSQSIQERLILKTILCATFWNALDRALAVDLPSKRVGGVITCVARNATSTFAFNGKASLSKLRNRAHNKHYRIQWWTRERVHGILLPQGKEILG